jgi:hypothetical protein
VCITPVGVATPIVLVMRVDDTSGSRGGKSNRVRMTEDRLWAHQPLTARDHKAQQPGVRTATAFSSSSLQQQLSLQLETAILDDRAPARLTSALAVTSRCGAR